MSENESFRREISVCFCLISTESFKECITNFLKGFSINEMTRHVLGGLTANLGEVLAKGIIGYGESYVYMIMSTDLLRYCGDEACNWKYPF